MDLTGSTDESTPWQNALNAMVGSAISCPQGRFKINTPLNATKIFGISINGPIGYSVPFSGSDVSTGCVILGNTNGHEVFDAIGSTSFHLNNLTIVSVGQSTPSQYGVLCGAAAGSFTGAPGGNDCSMTNVIINLTQGINSIAINHNNGGGIDTFVNVWTDSDYGFTFTSIANPLNITPTYGTYYATPQGGSDAIRCYGCTSLSNGGGYPIFIEGSSDIYFSRYYTAQVSNAGAGYTGVQYPIYLHNVYDIDIEIEDDYWPSVVFTQGTVDSARIKGLIFPSTTALATNQAFMGSFSGTSLTNSHFDIVGTGSAPTGTHFDYITTNTLTSNFGNSFTFNTNYGGADVCFLNSASGSQFFNWQFSGNTHTWSCVLQINGSTAPASAYRIFLNGIRYGTL